MAKSWASAKKNAKGHKRHGHEDGQGKTKVFFGNIPAQMPEAELREIVKGKAGDIATVHRHDPGPSRGPKLQSKVVNIVFDGLYCDCFHGRLSNRSFYLIVLKVVISPSC